MSGTSSLSKNLCEIDVREIQFIVFSFDGLINKEQDPIFRIGSHFKKLQLKADVQFKVHVFPSYHTINRKF